jgi:hypothetical protein
VGKIERGQTSRLNSKTKSVCAMPTAVNYALSIPVGYLDAVVSIPEKQQFCPKCWTPGSKPDTMPVNSSSKILFVMWDSITFFLS